jgi:hypothetical protein
MAIVSDGWSGLEELYRLLGIAPNFAGFAISEVIGYNTPDP